MVGYADPPLALSRYCVFLINFNENIVCIFINVLIDMKLGSIAYTLRNRIKMQRDYFKFDSWANSNKIHCI